VCACVCGTYIYTQAAGKVSIVVQSCAPLDRSPI